MVAVSDKKKSKSIMASIKSASKASASASKASASAHKTATHAPLQSEARKTTKGKYNTVNDPFHIRFQYD